MIPEPRNTTVSNEILPETRQSAINTYQTHQEKAEERTK